MSRIILDATTPYEWTDRPREVFMDRADKFQTHLPAADFNLTDGAGRHRQIARMSGFLNKDSVMNMLGAAMDKCSQGQGQGEGESTLPIWIVGSVAGGTGVGLFMDVALMARGASDKIQKRIIGAAVLPDVFGELSIDGARAYAALRELERFQAPVDTGYQGRVGGTDGVRFSVRYDAQTVIHLEDKLFDNLVFCNRSCNNGNERNAYLSQIADGLNLSLDQAAGNEIRSRWINAVEGQAFWLEEVADKGTLMAALTIPIPYQNTGIFKALRGQYVNERNKDEHESTWRAQIYHVFRCDQEAWHIERQQALKTGNRDFPEIPGALARLLDDPKRSKLFVQALVSGVIGQVTPSLRGVRVWACGKADEDNPDRLILLNNPDRKKDEPLDLLRAFVTFVMDKQDRRPDRQSRLEPDAIEGWIDAQLHESGKTLKQMAQEYRAAHPKRFEIRLDKDKEGAPAIGPDTFLALVLNHYLADLLDTER